MFISSVLSDMKQKFVEIGKRFSTVETFMGLVSFFFQPEIHYLELKLKQNIILLPYNLAIIDTRKFKICKKKDLYFLRDR